MVFKHLLLGLGGSAAIGGIGYGIYSSSQSSEKEEQKTKDTEKILDSASPSGGQDEGLSQLAGETEKNETRQGEGNGGITGSNSTISPENSSSQNGESPGGGAPQTSQ